MPVRPSSCQKTSGLRIFFINVIKVKLCRMVVLILLKFTHISCNFLSTFWGEKISTFWRKTRFVSSVGDWWRETVLLKTKCMPLVMRKLWGNEFTAEMTFYILNVSWFTLLVSMQNTVPCVYFFCSVVIIFRRFSSLQKNSFFLFLFFLFFLMFWLGMIKSVPLD